MSHVYKKYTFQRVVSVPLCYNMSDLGEVLGMFCLAQLISQTICRDSHRTGIEVPYTHLPARVRGSRWLVCSTRALMY